jgi:hypothetical protein
MGFSGDYAEATVTNPSSALTDFVLAVKLSRMPASWWSAVSTSDGTKGRASKGDGSTELACDWVDFDDTAETGYLFVKWSGTLASSGTQKLRIYPPKSGNSSYSASDTYGKNNVWSGHSFVVLGDSLTESNRKGSPAISVSTENGDPALGTDAWGWPKVTYDGNDNLKSGDDSLWDIGDSDDLTVELIFNVDSDNWNADWRALFGWYENSGDYLLMYCHDMTHSTWGTGKSVVYGGNISGKNITWRSSYDVLSANTTYLLTFTLDISSETVAMYLNGTDEYYDQSSSGPWSGTMYPDGIHLAESGWGGEYFTGDIGMFRLTKGTVRSEAWHDEDYAQLSDNATFWGTWSWVSGGTTHELAGTTLVPVSLSGDLEVEKLLGGTTLPVANISGDAEVEKLLGGTLLAEALISGDLTVGGLIELAGTTLSIASLSGDLEVEKLLAGGTISKSLMSGLLEVQKLLSGTTLAPLTMAGGLQVSKLLAGTTTVEVSLSGALSVIKALAGSTIVPGNLSADLLVSKLLAGETVVLPVSLGALLTSELSLEIIAGRSELQVKITGSSRLKTRILGRSRLDTGLEGESDIG